jgi:hypothetical protein
MGLSVSEGKHSPLFAPTAVHKHSPLFAPTAVHKHSPLFAPTAVHKTSCNIQQLSVQLPIANFSYYSPLQMDSSGYQTLCHVQLPVSDISKTLPHSLVNRQADCGTAGHCSLLPSQVLFQ